jgi:hypothetical protein
MTTGAIVVYIYKYKCILYKNIVHIILQLLKQIYKNSVFKNSLEDEKLAYLLENFLDEKMDAFKTDTRFKYWPLNRIIDFINTL